MITQAPAKCKQKTALLRVRDESLWVSCRSIMDNLCQAYSLATDCEIYHLYSELSTFEVIEELIKKKVKTIVFTDHRIRLMELLHSQRLINYIKQNNVKIIVHTFGCFVDRLLEYYEAGQILFGEDLILVGSSPKHVNLIQKVLKGPDSFFIPFPVNTDHFQFSAALREKYRTQLALDQDTLLFLYTGRISCLKNVELTMKLLAHKKLQGKKIKFLSIGNFDSFEPLAGQPYLGQMEQVHAHVQSQVDPHHEWCWHKEFIPQSELPSYLSSADAYISLSTFRGEDFGMAVAEAKSAGLPCFLTEWGGHGGFRELSHTTMARVKLTPHDILLDLSEMEAAIDVFKPLTQTQRITLAQETEALFGINAVAEKLKSLLESPPTAFKGLKPKLVSQRQMITSSGFGIMNELQELYEEYAR